MRRTDITHQAVPSLQATFDSAKLFGLTDDEIWRVVDDSLREVGGDASACEYLHELTSALARLVLAKERRRLSDQPG
jgi:hypothetical protein